PYLGMGVICLGLGRAIAGSAAPKAASPEEEGLAADLAKASKAQDSDKLETFRVPGNGATGWVFWNGGAEDVTVSRGGHSITVRSKRIGYLQIADDGALQVKEEL
ncbi:MAG: hypothetical protein IKX48_07680, partial [Victivallales bacterium]|nr:hypothetical protein [Victivallales bacterium]